MKKPLLSLLAVMLFSTAANGQGHSRVQREFLAGEGFGEAATTVPTSSVSLYLPLGLSLQYAYEQPLGALSTITGRVGFEGAGAWGSAVWGRYDGWMGALSIDIEPRFYYGLLLRERHGRVTDGNSGSFLALQVKNIMPAGVSTRKGAKVHGATLLSPVWGMRRVMNERWLLEFTVGYTEVWNRRGDTRNSPHLGVRFGHMF